VEVEAEEEPVEVVPGVLGTIPRLLQAPGSTLVRELMLTSTTLTTSRTRSTEPEAVAAVEQDRPSPQGCLKRFAALA
jgi:hypothetical protein